MAERTGHTLILLPGAAYYIRGGSLFVAGGNYGPVQPIGDERATVPNNGPRPEDLASARRSRGDVLGRGRPLRHGAADPANTKLLPAHAARRRHDRDRIARQRRVDRRARAMRLLARRRSRSAAPVKRQTSTDRYSYTTTGHDAPPRSAAHAPRQRMPAAIELRRRLRSLAAPDRGSVTSLSGFLGDLSIATATGIRTRVMLGQ